MQFTPLTIELKPITEGEVEIYLDWESGGSRLLKCDLKDLPSMWEQSATIYPGDVLRVWFTPPVDMALGYYDTKNGWWGTDIQIFTSMERLYPHPINEGGGEEDDNPA